MAETETLLTDHITAAIYLLENLGFVINHSKSELTPTQEIEFLGFTVNSTKLELRLPGKALQSHSVSALTLSRLIRKMNAAPQAIPMAPLYYRNLQTCLREALREEQSCSSVTSLTEEAREELEWWRDHFTQWNGRSLIVHNSSLTIKTDASKKGWGQCARSLHRGTMEPQRTDHAHQLPRAPSSLSGSAVFCQEQNKCDNPPQDGQHVNTDIHQHTWGNDLPTAEQPSQRDVAVVYEEEHPPQGPAPGRCVKHHRRRRVPSHKGPSRLDAVSRSVPPDQPEAGPSGGRPICQQTDVSAAGLCQLETRPLPRTHSLSTGLSSEHLPTHHGT